MKKFSLQRKVGIQLKSCPFCARRPSFDHFSFAEVPMWEARCPTGHAKTGMQRSPELAAELWNRRLPETPGELREVEVWGEDEDADENEG